ncbi:MAG: DUF6531 domain-containing protein [Acidobacteria bacterium]|nr:DUF6531 domain-containing protein [Acidobacteriota bacterium]
MCLIFVFGLAGAAFGSCRQCAPGGLGGPADNQYTAFDLLCSGEACRDAGLPQIQVNAATLNACIRVIDLSFGGSQPALSLERSYNTESSRSGPLGNGWTFNLGETLTAPTDSEPGWVLARASGRIDRFAESIDSKGFVPITRTSDLLSRNADGTYSVSAPGSTTVRKFKDGRLLAIYDGATQRVALEYDSAGRLTAARSHGHGIRFEYDGNSRITSATDSAGRTVGFVYDDQGNLVQQTNANGQAVSYGYDGAGRLSSIQTSAGQTIIEYADDADYTAVASITLADGSVRRYGTRNARDVVVTDGAGNATVFGSNSTGAIEAVTDPAGNRTSYVYNAAGQRIRTTLANGDVLGFDYDNSGNLTGVTDAGGNRWSADYSSGRLSRITDPNGNAYQFRYDAAGSLLAVADPLGGTVTATRNDAGLITSVVDANGNRNGFQYDSDGQLLKWTDALGGAWTYQYDGAARVASRAQPNGTAIQASYDSRNRLSAVSSGDAGSAFDYSGVERDGLNRVVRSTDSNGNQLTYSYGAAGRLAQITLPGDKSIAYEYDKAGRLARVSDWLGNFALYRYDAAGYLTSVNVSGGPVVIYQYDRARNLSALIASGADGSMVAGYRYSLDAAANRVGLSALEPSPGPLQLASLAFIFDAANRVSSRDDGQSYTYDAGGNLLSISGAGQTSFSYDAFGRLSGMASDTATTAYAYDNLGLRVERNTNGSVRRFVYDMSGARPQVVMETDGDGNAVAYYVHGLGLLWKIEAGSGKTYFYNFDGDGNVVALTDPSAGVVNRYRYDPLGKLAAADEAVENPFRMRGESGWMDDGNGLLYRDGAFYFPDLRAVLRGSVELSPPYPRLLPNFPPAAACFTEGVAACQFAGGRRVNQ